MRFVKGEGAWHLVDDESRVLATLRDEVEVLALREFCVFFVADDARVPERFQVEHGGRRYVVTPLGGPGEPLTLVIAGPEEWRSTVQTGLVLRPTSS
jgi:hypothetical protein